MRVGAGILVAGCSRCGNRSRFGNCLIPVDAGIADRHQLIRHPDGGRDCSAFKPKPIPAEARIARLLSMRLIEEWEADLMRSSYSTSQREWDRLMGDIERTGKTIPSVLPDAVPPVAKLERRAKRS